MKALKIVGVLMIIFGYTMGMGSGWFFIYDVGLRSVIEPLYSLPVMPVRSFVIAYTIILWIRSLYDKTDRKEYKLSDPEPYGKMLSHILTIYMYVLVIWLFYWIF